MQKKHYNLALSAGEWALIEKEAKARSITSLAVIREALAEHFDIKERKKLIKVYIVRVLSMKLNSGRVKMMADTFGCPTLPTGTDVIEIAETLVEFCDKEKAMPRLVQYVKNYAGDEALPDLESLGGLSLFGLGA